MINVEGDSIGAGIVAHLSRKELSDEDAKQEDDLVYGNGHIIAENEVAGSTGAFIIPTVIENTKL